MDLYEEILKLKKKRNPCAVATIVQTAGSVPRKEGAKMLVRADGSIAGTIGGGCLEAEVIELSLHAVRTGSPVSVPFDLSGRNGGLVCGGKMLVYIEPIVPDPRLVILGAGHVGKALSTIARFCGFEVTAADDRQEFANAENIRDAYAVVVSELSQVFSTVPVDRSTSIVIATRGHTHDLDALKAALMTEAGYIGLVGSRRKKTIFVRMLREAGFTESDIERTIIPAGLPIGSVTPEEIAVSIMAQIVQRRRSAMAPVDSASCGKLVTQDGGIKAAPSA